MLRCCPRKIANTVMMCVAAFGSCVSVVFMVPGDTLESHSFALQIPCSRIPVLTAARREVMS